jgi:uncharacterized BrkB/YihY/UPF0761 family membrane protein
MMVDYLVLEMNRLIVPLQSEILVGPILLILGVLFLVVSFVLTYWVYTDAQKRGNDNAALWALAVGVLWLVTFFGGILALVVYIWDRN